MLVFGISTLCYLKSKAHSSLSQSTRILCSRNKKQVGTFKGLDPLPHTCQNLELGCRFDSRPEEKLGQVLPQEVGEHALLGRVCVA